MPEKKHARLGASSSHRWFNCPASIQACEGIPNESSPYAEEGSAAHEVAEACLNNGQDAIEYVDRTMKGYEKYPVTEEMAEAVQVYLDAVRADLASAPDAELAVETKFDLSHIHPECFGTNDASIYFPSQAKLVVYDYKHGQGVAVEPENNSQMLYYAVGALTGKHNRPVNTIELVIAQPRCFHHDSPVRRWTTNALDVLDWIADMKEAARATEVENPKFQPGDWCKFCPAAPTCPALQQFSMDVAKADFAPDGTLVVSNPETYSSEAIAETLEHVEILENWARAFKAYAHNEAEGGRKIPGYKLVDKRAMRKWKSEDRTIKELKEAGLVPSQLYQPGKLRSPAQMETMLKKEKLDKSVIDELWEKVSSGTTLVPDGDKRERAKPLATEEFSSIEDENSGLKGLF